MAELLTRQIVYEYQKRLKALPDYGNQDIRSGESYGLNYRIGAE